MNTEILADVEQAMPTPAQFLPMETDEALYELVNGQRVELPAMSLGASTVAGRLYGFLNSFAVSLGRGEAFIETLIQLPVPEDAERMRRPDVFFVTAAKLVGAPPANFDVNAWAVVPDLVVEVTSPTDRAEAQREKVQEYLLMRAGCLWVVYPQLRIVDVYEPSGAVRTFGPDGVLPGDPVLPGFELSLDELFRPIGAGV